MLFLLSLFPALMVGGMVANMEEDEDGVVLQGDDSDDSLTGGAGDDDLFGGNGADTLVGGAGNDIAQGSSGDDLIIGNEGNDALQGRGNDDTVMGFSGTDWVDGNDGDDLVRGGQGDDVVIGGEGADAIFGRADDDLLVAGELPGSPLSNAQLDVLRDGGDATDILGDPLQFNDDGAADTLDGGTGDDILLFGAGDSATGGDGTDEFVVLGTSAGADIGPAVIEDFETGGDEDLVVLFNSDLAADNAEITVAEDGEDAIVSVNGEELARVVGAAGELSADDIAIAQPNEEPDTIEGTDDADTITGTGEADIINARDSDDDIEGGFGDDTINGDGGADVIQGQGGFDRISGNAGNDLMQGRGGDDTLSGNQGDDWVDGNDGDDMLNGGLNADTVIGGMGSDLMSGGEGGDVLVSGEVLANPLTTAQLDAVRDTQPLAMATGIVLGDTVFLNDDGAADTLDGGNAADILFFGAGDTATGGAGADDFGLIANSAGNGLGAAIITDFNSAEDEVFVVLDSPDGQAAPLVTVVDDGDDAVISVGGEVLARVTGGAGSLTASGVNLVSGVATEVIDPNL